MEFSLVLEPENVTFLYCYHAFQTLVAFIVIGYLVPSLPIERIEIKMLKASTLTGERILEVSPVRDPPLKIYCTHVCFSAQRLSKKLYSIFGVICGKYYEGNSQVSLIVPFKSWLRRPV